MFHKNRHKNQIGGALIEVLVASAILAVALLSLITFQANLFRDRGLLNQESMALSLAQNQMQSFRQYTALNTTPGQFAYSDIVNSASPTIITENGATFSISWTVTNSNNDDLPVRKTVVVTVSWTDPTNTARSVSITSVIARIDPNAAGQISRGLGS